MMSSISALLWQAGSTAISRAGRYRSLGCVMTQSVLMEAHASVRGPVLSGLQPALPSFALSPPQHAPSLEFLFTFVPFLLF